MGSCVVGACAPPQIGVERFGREFGEGRASTVSGGHGVAVGEGAAALAGGCRHWVLRGVAEGVEGERDRFGEQEPLPSARAGLVHHHGNGAAERAPDADRRLERQLVEHGEDVIGEACEVVLLGLGWRVGRAMAAEIDRDWPTGLAQDLGDRFVEAPAEPVGVQQHHGRAITAPVERGDRGLVARDLHNVGAHVGHVSCWLRADVCNEVLESCYNIGIQSRAGLEGEDVW